jgi:hypothetical protein
MAENEALSGLAQKQQEVLETVKNSEEMVQIGLLALTAAVAATLVAEAGIAIVSSIRSMFMRAVPIGTAAKTSGALDKAIEGAEQLAPAVESQGQVLKEKADMSNVVIQWFREVNRNNITIGRDMLDVAKKVLARDITLNPQQKVEALEFITKQMNQIDTQWSAKSGPIFNAAAMYTGELRPFGILIDWAGKVWVTQNVNLSGTHQKINGAWTYVADFSKWNRVQP